MTGTRQARAVLEYADRALRVVEELVPAGLILVMSLGVSLDVAGRFLLETPIRGTPELATAAMIWMVFLGSAAATRRGLHIAIDLVVRGLPPRGQAAVALLVSVVTIGVLALLAVWGWELAAGTQRSLQMTGISARYVWIALPVGAVLMMVRELVAVVRAIYGLRQGTYAAASSSFEEEFV